MGTILKFPPCVKHVGHRPPQELQSSVIDRALLNLRAPKAACKLMKFYAAQATGFRPSLKMINDAIGVGEKNISTIRMILVKRGLIGYDGKTILIDWLRLSALASVDTKLMGQRKHWNIAPVSCNLLDEAKTQVHNYIGTENLIYGPDGYQLGVGWYNPFDEPDPDWVYQLAVIDAYGEIIAYTHYNTQLPF